MLFKYIPGVLALLSSVQASPAPLARDVAPRRGVSHPPSSTTFSLGKTLNNAPLFDG